LLEQLRSSSQSQAWADFVSLYTPLIAHWARRLGVPSAETADFLQDVFLHLVQKLPELSYDPSRRFRGWLWTVVRNRWLEQRRRAGPVCLTGSGDALAEARGPDPSEEVAEEEYARILTTRALELMREEFHPTTWRACWGLVVEERPATEVAAELGLSLNAVYIARSRVLHRVRQKLAGLLD
jgi:RNA polymerase sigma-70 factor (ECF subfamily)